MGETIKVLVGGANGYAGEELVDRLNHHAYVDTVIPFGREFPDDDTLEIADAAILAIPNGESAPIAARLRQKGKWVADLSSDLRLESSEEYQRWHGKPHLVPNLLDTRIPYVVPELNPNDIADHKLLSLTGCYAIASILGTAPLIKAGLIEPDDTIRINAISGVSGMGKARKAEADEIMASGEVRTYRAGRAHPHVPEIERYLGGRSVFFVPSVGPYFRGIVAHVDMKLQNNAYDRDVQEALEEAYADEPHITIRQLGDLPTKNDTKGTDTCHIGLVADNRELHVVSSIDNLGRGAAAGGILALNVAHGFPKMAGLLLA